MSLVRVPGRASGRAEARVRSFGVCAFLLRWGLTGADLVDGAACVSLCGRNARRGGADWRRRLGDTLTGTSWPEGGGPVPVMQAQRSGRWSVHSSRTL